MGNTALYLTNERVPRSKDYQNKKIVKESMIEIKGTRYYKRVFFDGSVELVRYDYVSEKWVFLLFTS